MHPYKLIQLFFLFFEYRPWNYNTNEPQLQKTYLLTCLPNEDSNQPAHPRSLISVFIVRMKKKIKKMHPWLSKLHPVKNLIRLRERTGWSESSQDAHVQKVRFLTLRFNIHLNSYHFIIQIIISNVVSGHTCVWSVHRLPIVSGLLRITKTYLYNVTPLNPTCMQ